MLLTSMFPCSKVFERDISVAPAVIAEKLQQDGNSCGLFCMKVRYSLLGTTLLTHCMPSWCKKVSHSVAQSACTTYSTSLTSLTLRILQFKPSFGLMCMTSAPNGLVLFIHWCGQRAQNHWFHIKFPNLVVNPYVLNNGQFWWWSEFFKCQISIQQTSPDLKQYWYQ